MNVDTTRKKNWAYIFSPYISIAVIVVGIYLLKPFELEGQVFRSLAFVMLLPCLIIGLSIDVMLRALLLESKRKVLYIWIAESILVVIVLIIFYLFGYFTTRFL